MATVLGDRGKCKNFYSPVCNQEDTRKTEVDNQKRWKAEKLEGKNLHSKVVPGVPWRQHKLHTQTLRNASFQAERFVEAG